MSPPQMTLAEFDVWALLPEHVNTEYEYICGEVVLRSISDYWASVITAHLSTLIMLYAKQQNSGHVMDAKVGFRVGDERFVPIATYTENSRWINLTEVCYLPFTPTLAIESLSSLRHPKHLRRKIASYLLHGVTVWVIDSEDEEIEMYCPHQPVRVLRNEDMLRGNQNYQDLLSPSRHFSIKADRCREWL